MLSFLVAAYPTANVSEQTSTLYAAALVQLPYGLAMEAATALVAESRWFPTLAELLARASAVQAWHPERCRGCRRHVCVGCDWFVPPAVEVIRNLAAPARLLAERQTSALPKGGR